MARLKVCDKLADVDCCRQQWLSRLAVGRTVGVLGPGVQISSLSTGLDKATVNSSDEVMTAVPVECAPLYVTTEHEYTYTQTDSLLLWLSVSFHQPVSECYNRCSTADSCIGVCISPVGSKAAGATSLSAERKKIERLEHASVWVTSSDRAPPPNWVTVCRCQMTHNFL